MKALTRYQIIVLGDRGTIGVNILAQSCCLAMHRPGVELDLGVAEF